jgi:hypothetical protein
VPPAFERRLVFSVNERIGGMGRILILWFMIGLMLGACRGNPAPPAGKSETAPASQVIVEREKSVKEDPLPPEVKIRLKKDGKDAYSWELSGSDVDQILKVNEKLKKQLGGESRK